MSEDRSQQNEPWRPKIEPTQMTRAKCWACRYTAIGRSKDSVVESLVVHAAVAHGARAIPNG